MKQDECDMLVGHNPAPPAKRRAWLMQKWARKGWIKNGQLTPAALSVRDAIMQLRSDGLGDYDGKIVKVFYKELPPTVGIIHYNNEDGYAILWTVTAVSRYFHGWWLDEDDVAYVLPYPSRKYWRKINYLYWKKHGVADFFHEKVTEFSKVVYRTGGVVGECFDWCQCKNLKED